MQDDDWNLPAQRTDALTTRTRGGGSGRPDLARKEDVVVVDVDNTEAEAVAVAEEERFESLHEPRRLPVATSEDSEWCLDRDVGDDDSLLFESKTKKRLQKKKHHHRRQHPSYYATCVSVAVAAAVVVVGWQLYYRSNRGDDEGRRCGSKRQ